MIATTFGGNAITKSPEEARICFADHSWYSDDQICYQDLAGGRAWKTVPMNDENFLRSLFALAANPEEFESLLTSGKIDEILYDID